MPYAAVHLREPRMLRLTRRAMIALLVVTLCCDVYPSERNETDRRKRELDDVDDIITFATMYAHAAKRARLRHRFEFVRMSIALGNNRTHLDWSPHKFREEFRFDRHRFREIMRLCACLIS